MQTSTDQQINRQYCVVLCTCPDENIANEIATMLVENKLAACVNILPGLSSIYKWQGSLEHSQEHLLILKTKSTSFQSVTAAILERHPYELPEIISIPINNGLMGYLSWIESNVSP